jgi:hypothetical protein
MFTASSAVFADEEAPELEASVTVEQDATDGELEVMFEMDGDEEVLETVLVMAPNGRIVINSTFVEGMRVFEFESPEATDINLLKQSYPEGFYFFFATNQDGVLLMAAEPLSYALPQPTTFLSPTEGQTGVPLDTNISWSAVPDVEGYIVEVENEELDVEFEIELPASTTTIGVPAGFLVPNTEYELQIGTVSEEDNISFVETTFTTAAQ